MVHPTKTNARGTQQPGRNRRRNDRGLTTLEWLLIVAAVAGLAALAVVLVQNVVDDTAEQISGNNARLTAAQVAAEAINDDDKLDDEKEAACNRLSITYSDAFADTPSRTSLFTDADTADGKDKVGGVCGIVTEMVAAHIRVANAAACTLTEIGKLDGFETAHLGGKTVKHATAGDPDCHFIP